MSLLVASTCKVSAQAALFEFPMETLELKDMTAFKPVAKNWRIGGDVSTDITKDLSMQAKPGTGVLINLPDAKDKDNLLTVMEHGDLDLELDIMMARHSNSGIYLQGRYEIQILDSWAKERPTYGDMGGVYQRWDDSKPEGQQGYQGFAPRINVAKAPGLWQHLRVEFNAPRFDATGKKIKNARIIKIQLNGVTIMENIELTGPTRGPLALDEVAKGPILIQGDHGPVAFRNVRYRSYAGAPVALNQLKYESYSWEKETLPDFNTIKPSAQGDLNPNSLTWEIAQGNNDFAVRFKGNLNVPASGKYNFSMSSFGVGMVKLGKDTIIGPVWGEGRVMKELAAGNYPFEVAYCKHAEWMQAALAVTVEGANFRPTPLYLPSSFALTNPTNPIFLDPKGDRPEVFRSFIDVRPDTSSKVIRVVHPISVGYPNGVSYSFDLDAGTLFQVWRGGFLEVTPMWSDRGDGHADPRGAVVGLGLAPQLAPVGASFADSVTVDANYKFNNYTLDQDGNPTFEYTLFGEKVKDAILPSNDKKQLKRTLTLAQGSKLQFRAVVANKIEAAGPNTWLVGDKAYYIQVPNGVKPQIKTNGKGMQEMIVPAVNGTITYEVIW